MVQLVRPTADVSIGSWTTQAGGTTNLYQTLDETVADDADYIKVSDAADTTYRMALGTYTDPVVLTAHVARIRPGKLETSRSIDFVATLINDADESVIAERAFMDVDEPTTQTMDLTAAEADAIAYPADVDLQLVAVPYLGRDRFLTDVLPLAPGTAEPGPSTRTVIGDYWLINDDLLRGGFQPAATTPTWGESIVAYDGDARAAGRTVAAYVIPMDNYALLAFGWGTSPTPGTPMTHGHFWIVNGGLFTVSTPGKAISPAQNNYNTHPKEYLAVIVQRGQGALYLLSTVSDDRDAADLAEDPIGVPGYPNARLLWVADADTTGVLYPLVTALDSPDPYTNGHALTDVRWVDVDTWTADGALATILDRATKTRTSSTIAAGSADGFVRIKMTFDSSSATRGIGIRFRQTDANNYLRIWTNNAAEIRFETVVAGTPSLVTTTAKTWVVSQQYDIVLLMVGSKVRVFVDGTDPYSGWLTVGSNTGGTGFGPYDASGTTNATWTDLAHYPHTVALPPKLRTGTRPIAWTAGTTLSTTAVPTEATIYDTGMDTYEVSVTVNLGTDASLPAGLEFASGASAAMRVRIFDGSTSEIEFLEITLGENGVAKKVDLGAGRFANVNGPFAIKIQVTPGLVRVFINGVIRMSHVPNAAFSGTTVKPYRQVGSDATFANLVVKELDTNGFTLTSPVLVPDPSAIFGSNLAIWLDADDIIGGTGDQVATWPNQGTGADFVQAIGGAQPHLQLGVVNGHDAVDFDGVDEFMQSASAINLSGTNAVEMWFVLSNEASAAAYVVAEHSSNYNDGPGRWIVYKDASHLILANLQGNVGYNNVTTDAANAIAGGSGYHAIRVQFDMGITGSNESLVEVDGNSTVTLGTQTDNTGNFTSQVTYLGVRGDTVSLLADMRLATWVLVDRNATAAERTAMIAYLSNRYGV